MKSVCGYEGDDFIIPEGMRVMQKKEEVYGPGIYSTDDFEQIYACPKCGTIKIEKGEKK
jgi:hypothetical protein